MKGIVKKHLINARGRGVKGKFLVIESDDWGSIRIPNQKVRDILFEKELISSQDSFSKFDCLESKDDFTETFKVLSLFQDIKGNPPIITGNVVMANPDFARIKQSEFEEYSWELFTKTYKNYYPNQNVREAMQLGMDKKLFHPQFHAREHLNVIRWMERLKSGNEAFLEAFKLNCFAINDQSKDNLRSNLMASYDYDTIIQKKEIERIISQGLKLFQKEFGFESMTSIAPCYVWNNSIEDIFYCKGKIKGIQSSYVQLYNSIGNIKYRKIYRKQGEVNRNGQVYTVRNVLFEPSTNDSINWVKKGLESISIAFQWSKPAVISMHRLNFVGSLSAENRNNSLSQLHDLLQQVRRRWPDVEFISSSDLLTKYINE